MRMGLPALLASAIFAVSAAAHASQMDYFDLGDGYVTFTLPASPVVDVSNHGLFLGPIDFKENGVSKVAPLGNFTFGFDLRSDLGTYIDDLSFTGPALYSGPYANFTFTPGTYDLQSNFTGESYQLTITPVTTPEPGSLVLLGTGTLGMIGVLRRRVFA